MKIKEPQPFTFEAGPRAVLLLHGFTGHTADVRMLGRFLEKKGYTSHAPIYAGHGKPPEALLDVSAEDWWEDVKSAYKYLQDLGYEEIAVAGLSLGGVLGSKLAYSNKVKALIPMCAPMFFDNEKQLTLGFESFSREYKQLEEKDEAVIEKEVDALIEDTAPLFKQLGDLITKGKNNIKIIHKPIMVVQARKDEIINIESANYIYDNIESDDKEMKWYEESGHVITLDKERNQLHEDIYQFLEKLDWKE